MKDRDRRGIIILAAGLIAGVLSNYLFRAALGINVFLWILMILILVAGFARFEKITLAGEGRWLALPLLFFAGAFAWRDSIMLQMLDMLLLFLTLGLAAVCSKSGLLQRTGIVDMVLYLVAGWSRILAGAVSLLFLEIAWQSLPRGKWLAAGTAYLRGVLLAVPLILLFGVLFVMADAFFEQLVGRLFAFGLTEALDDLFVTAFFACVIIGMLYSTFLARDLNLKEFEKWFPPISLGMIEIGTVLGALNILFFLFVLVQFRYFFGGEFLLASTGMTYAEYARRGFFELVAVTALVLPVLLTAHWLLEKQNPVHERSFRILSGALIAMVFVIMSSAIYRLWLYQSQYGLTELRLYAGAFLVWLAIVFLWFLATVHRGRRDRFAFGALAAGFLIAAALHGINPDAWIARINVARFHDNGRFDVDYAVSLSADAVPVLIEALPALPEEMRAQMAASILRQYETPWTTDWRAWNWGRARAWRETRNNRALLEEHAALAVFPER